VEKLLFDLLIKAGVSSISATDLELQLISHNEYPSLKAITDTLDYFDIENIAANVPKDAFDQLPNSFLALIDKDDQSELVFLQKKKNENVILRDSSYKKIKTSVPKFMDVWSGTLVAVEQVSITKSKTGYFKTYSLGIGMLLLFFLGVLENLNTSFYTMLYVVLGFFGLLVSYLIVKEHLGVKDTVNSRFCGILSSNPKGCAAVINSKESKLLNGLGLGDLSFVYFLSLIMVAVTVGVKSSFPFVVAILSLPIVLYAFYIQATKLKEWCFLCLVVSGILISQFVVLFIAYTGWDLSFIYSLKSISILVLVAILWFGFKEKYKASQELYSIKKDYLSFKRNASFFMLTLKKGRIENLQELPKRDQISFGNTNAQIELTAYTNPLCGYCSSAFETYNKLLKRYPKEIKVQFIFNTAPDPTNSATQIAARILELYDDNQQNAYKALQDWFDTKDIVIWEERYGKYNNMLLKYTNQLEIHRNLSRSNGITYTPETLIGDCKFPRQDYEYDDLLLFVDHLKGEKEKKGVIISNDMIAT